MNTEIIRKINQAKDDLQKTLDDCRVRGEDAKKDVATYHLILGKLGGLDIALRIMRGDDPFIPNSIRNKVLKYI